MSSTSRLIAPGGTRPGGTRPEGDRGRPPAAAGDGIARHRGRYTTQRSPRGPSPHRPHRPHRPHQDSRQGDRDAETRVGPQRKKRKSGLSSTARINPGISFRFAVVSCPEQRQNDSPPIQTRQLLAFSDPSHARIAPPRRLGTTAPYTVHLLLGRLGQVPSIADAAITTSDRLRPQDARNVAHDSIRLIIERSCAICLHPSRWSSLALAPGSSSPLLHPTWSPTSSLVIEASPLERRY